MNGGINRSPLFYVGDKYKLMGQIKNLFPKEINNFYEPFVGGGAVFLNIEAKKYYLNDIDKNLIKIHKYLIKYADKPEIFFKNINKLICKYNLSRSYQEDVVPEALKKNWKKTYFAKFNKESYEKLRNNFNKSRNKDPLILYILLIYGFNRMLRFNDDGRFNLPVGNVDFNTNVLTALKNYFDYVRDKEIEFESMDFRQFLSSNKYSKNDFIYLDPPYLITASEYNKLWDQDCELDLLNSIDKLNKRGVRFALSNVTYYNGTRNKLLIKWMKGYKVYKIKSNYINYYDNSVKKIGEVLVTNYD